MGGCEHKIYDNNIKWADSNDYAITTTIDKYEWNTGDSNLYRATSSYPGTLTASTYDTIKYALGRNIRYAMDRDAATASSIYIDDLAYREHDFFSNSATNTESYGMTWSNGAWESPTPEDRMRQMIRDRMGPAIHCRRNSMSIAKDVREERARQTLRRILGDQAFKKFIRNGFITVVPKSGLTYRIYPGSGMTDVYDRGIKVDRLCVVLAGNFPPTDSLIMRYLLILNDEGEFSKYAIKHHVSQNSKKLIFPAQEVKPLTEAWAKLKVA